MALYDCFEIYKSSIFTVLIIGISTYLATKNIISAGSVLTAYLCFNQLIKPLEELHRIFDELSECTVLAKDFFNMIEIPNDFSYNEIEKKENKYTGNSTVDISDLRFIIMKMKAKLY